MKVELEQFKQYEVIHIFRSKNHHADALSKLALSRDVDLLRIILLKVLTEPSFHAQEEVIEVEMEKSWMDDIKDYRQVTRRSRLCKED